ncbi:hypothetical protein BBF96_13905 [Anoxybacter fermentans]|uniref:ABC transporter domain-containing protein n=1 Tax=Anoxybacter fermentans TaxID=1323375 RepID=A0A3Q9HS28_9FIRM|nr:ATP-binding cassette domain-containing protein [Anoxybacter fermentans]AZR74384.1 hypothetical protein BBF96_13905 [Anoxybacter fermentans]
MIEVTNLSKTYKIKRRKFKTVLNDINFSVDDGEIVACLGKNGSGKSTLIKLLCGVLSPSSGEIKINNLNPYKDRKKLLKNIGVLFSQKSVLIWDLPLIESFKLYRDVYRMDKKVFEKNLNFLVEKLNLEKLLHHPVRKFSFGERIKSEFAVTMIHKPKYIFLDEPTVGLDEITKSIFRNLIKEYVKETKATVFFATHLLGDVESIASKIMLLNDGTLQYYDTMEEFRKKYLTHKIISIYYTRVNNYQAFKELRLNCNVLQESFDYIRIKIDNKTINDMLPIILNTFDIIDISITDISLRNVIKEIYQQ